MANSVQRLAELIKNEADAQFALVSTNAGKLATERGQAMTYLGGVESTEAGKLSAKVTADNTAVANAISDMTSDVEDVIDSAISNPDATRNSLAEIITELNNDAAALATKRTNYKNDIDQRVSDLQGAFGEVAEFNVAFTDGYGVVDYVNPTGEYADPADGYTVA